MNTFVCSDYVKLRDLMNSVQSEQYSSDVSIADCFENISALIKMNSDALAAECVNETGKPIKFCYEEIERCVRLFQFGISCLLMSKHSSGIIHESSRVVRWYINRRPLGTVLGMTPFSSPYSSLVHKMLACIVSGNNFICIPSIKTIKSSSMLFDIISSSIDQKLVGTIGLLTLSDVQMIHYVLSKCEYNSLLFTGKSTTAREIKKIIGRKQAVFETGSSTLAYISNTSDHTIAAKEIVKGAFNQSGMRCIAVKNVFVHESIYEVFLDELLESVDKLVVGDPADLKTDVGPVVDSEILFSSLQYIKKLVMDGYILTKGGRIINDNFLEPTILQDTTIHSFFSTEEAYVPMLVVHRVRNFSSIPKHYINRSSLNISIYSNDSYEIDEWIKYCSSAGSIYVNLAPSTRFDAMPFGGYNDENDGKEGIESLSRFLSKEQIIFAKSL